METEKTTPEEEIVKKPIETPDTGGPHDCPKNYVWSDEQQMCIPDIG